MKIRIGNLEDTFKDPNQLETASTITEAYFNRFTNTVKLNLILMVWDNEDNLLAVRDISKWVNVLEDTPTKHFILEHDLNAILKFALQNNSR